MDHFMQTEMTRVWQRPPLDLLTVFPGETNNNRRFWSQPKFIHSLNFEQVWSEGVGIIDVVLGPFGGCVLPLLSGVSPFPPHQILQVGSVPVFVG